MYTIPCAKEPKGLGQNVTTIHFHIMNFINASTGFSNFQIHLGRLPCLIPPLVPHSLKVPTTNESETLHVAKLMSKLQMDVAKAKDNLMLMKVFQMHHANKSHSTKVPFKIGDKVMLSRLHHCQEFKSKGQKRAAKLFLHFDEPYDIIDSHIETSNYTLNQLNSPNTYPT